MASNYHTRSEVRVVALSEAVKVATTKPTFHGSMEMPAIVEFTTSNILKMATDFEDYIWNGHNG